MKKTIGLLITCIMIISLCACGSESEQKNESAGVDFYDLHFALGDNWNLTTAENVSEEEKSFFEDPYEYYIDGALLYNSEDESGFPVVVNCNSCDNAGVDNLKDYEQNLKDNGASFDNTEKIDIDGIEALKTTTYKAIDTLDMYQVYLFLDNGNWYDFTGFAAIGEEPVTFDECIGSIEIKKKNN